MATKSKKGLGLVIFSLVAVAGVVGYIVWKKYKEKKDGKKDEKTPEPLPSENQTKIDDTKPKADDTKPKTEKLEDVGKTLGANIINGKIKIFFNNDKNFAEYYPNQRFGAFKTGTSGYLVKGYWYNGGRKLVIDGGKTIDTNSAWASIIESIKP